MTPNAILNQGYPTGRAYMGLRVWRFSFLCPRNGTVDFYRAVPVLHDEFAQAALARATVASIRSTFTR